MIKLTLCILILFSGAVIGVHLSQRLIRRRDILLGFDILFHSAAIRIEYNAGDLSEVFSENFAEYPFTHSLPFVVQWQRFVNSFAYHLKKDDIRLLSDFTKGLGTTDSKAQQNHIALYTTLLQEHIRLAQEDIRVKSGMYRIVPLSAGIALSLLLI